MSIVDKNQEGSELATQALTLSQTLLNGVEKWQDISKLGCSVIGSEVLDRLESSLLRTTSIIRTLKNASCPAVRLPPEVLAVIFSLVARTLPFDIDPHAHFPPSRHNFLRMDDLRPITIVCRHWRRVALGTPSLWSTVLDSVPGCDGGRALHVHYLSRCTSGPLYVALRKKLEQDTIDAFSDSGRASRVREIYVYQGGPRFQDLISIPLPNLEHCFLNHSPDVQPRTQRLFGNCDGLRTLLLYNASFLPINHFPSLTRLRLNRLGSFTSLRLSALFDLLSRAPVLVQLELQGLGPQETDVGLEEQNLQRVQLDHLERLTISDFEYYFESYHGQRSTAFRRGLLEHLSIPAACAISIGIFDPSELRYIMDTTWQGHAVADMRLVIKRDQDKCAFMLEVANPSASRKTEFEVMRRCRTRPGPARDAVVEAVALVLVADVAQHPALSAIRTLCIEFQRVSQWSPFVSGNAFLAGFLQLEVLKVTQDSNDDVRVNTILSALEVSPDGPGVRANVSVACPLLAALTVDCVCPEDDIYVKDLARLRAEAGFAISRGFTIGSWEAVGPDGREKFLVRQYDPYGERISSL